MVSLTQPETIIMVGGENNPDDIIVMSSELLEFRLNNALKLDIFLTNLKSQIQNFTFEKKLIVLYLNPVQCILFCSFICILLLYLHILFHY